MSVDPKNRKEGDYFTVFFFPRVSEKKPNEIFNNFSIFYHSVFGAHWFWLVIQSIIRKSYSVTRKCNQMVMWCDVPVLCSLIWTDFTMQPASTVSLCQICQDTHTLKHTIYFGLGDSFSHNSHRSERDNFQIAPSPPVHHLPLVFKTPKIINLYPVFSYPDKKLIFGVF